MQPCLLPERPAPSQFRDLSGYQWSSIMSRAAAVNFFRPLVAAGVGVR
jgi:hypothetical protein